MIAIGKWNTLTIVRSVPFGVYLAETEEADTKDSVLLPEKQVPEGAKTGDRLSVFIYRDSDDRLIATVHEPALTMGQVRHLTVAQVAKVGAFLDWGLEKDLFLPFREQTRKVGEGDRVLCALYEDKSGRLCATMNVYPYLSTNCPFHAGAQVDGTVYETSENFGAFVAVADTYSGLIPKAEAGVETLFPGDAVSVRISRVLADGKLELSLHKKAYQQMDADAEKIFSIIKEKHKGTLPFDDKADPETIRKQFGMSKAAFKRAVGALYRQRRIALGDGTIRVIE